MIKLKYSHIFNMTKAIERSSDGYMRLTEEEVAVAYYSGLLQCHNTVKLLGYDVLIEHKPIEYKDLMQIAGKYAHYCD